MVRFIQAIKDAEWGPSNGGVGAFRFSPERGRRDPGSPRRRRRVDFGQTKDPVALLGKAEETDTERPVE